MQEQVFNLGQKMTPEQEIDYLRRRVAEYEDEARGKCMQVRLALVKENSCLPGFSLEDTENLVQYVINGLPTPASPEIDDSIQISAKVAYQPLKDAAEVLVETEEERIAVARALNSVCDSLGWSPVAKRVYI